MGGMGAELHLVLHYQLFTLTCTEVRSSTEWGRASHGLGQTHYFFHKMTSLFAGVGPGGEAMLTLGSQAVKLCHVPAWQL